VRVWRAAHGGATRDCACGGERRLCRCDEPRGEQARGERGLAQWGE
jgi:hypothetical protein